MALVAVLVLPAPPAPAAKRKPVQCKASQVVVKVGKRKTCRARAKAFPKPRAGDPRLEFLQTALDRALSVRGLPRSPRRLKGKARRSARSGTAKIRRALPQVLALIDAQTASASRSRAACSEPPAQPSTATVGGGSVTINGQGADMSVEGGGFRVLMSMSLGSFCDRFDGPQCPTAAGVLTGTDRSRFNVSLTVFQGNTVVSRINTSRDGRMQLEGRSADDALFDTLEIADRVDETIQSGPVNISAVVSRRATIDMRSGLWLPENATVRVNYVMVGGRILDDAEARNIQQGLAGDYDRDFPTIVNREIGVYRGREASMKNPGECATLKLTPASGSLAPLELGASGALTATAEARNGGGSAVGRFTASGQENGRFAPEEARGASGAFTWVVANTGEGVRLRAYVKATSKAGTTERLEWSQPTKPPKPTVKRIAGNLSGANTAATMLGPSVISHEGSVTYERTPPPGFTGAVGTYPLKAGTITFHASGVDRSFASGCHQQGTATFPLESGSFDVQSNSGDFEPPYTYAFTAYPPTQSKMTITRVQCPPGAESLENTTFELIVDVITTADQHPSADGLSYQDSEDNTSGGSGTTLTWSLTGET